VYLFRFGDKKVHGPVLGASCVVVALLITSLGARVASSAAMRSGRTVSAGSIVVTYIQKKSAPVGSYFMKVYSKTPLIAKNTPRILNDDSWMLKKTAVNTMMTTLLNTFSTACVTNDVRDRTKNDVMLYVVYMSPFNRKRPKSVNTLNSLELKSTVSSVLASISKNAGNRIIKPSNDILLNILISLIYPG
jgi:hypothetical protein